MGPSYSPPHSQRLTRCLAHRRACNKDRRMSRPSAGAGGLRPRPLPVRVPNSALLSPGRCAEAPGTRGGVRVHSAQCLRPFCPHRALGGAWREGQHQLCQDRVLGHRDIPHEALLWREGAQVGRGRGPHSGSSRCRVSFLRQKSGSRHGIG